MIMGQYFLIVNLDKKEYIDPGNFGAAKLWEICVNNVSAFLAFLLRKSDEIGCGGDIKKPYNNAGRWAGDRIVVVGDYDRSGLYDKAKKKFRDIGWEVALELSDFINDKLGTPEWEVVRA